MLYEGKNLQIFKHFLFAIWILCTYINRIYMAYIICTYIVYGLVFFTKKKVFILDVWISRILVYMWSRSQKVKTSEFFCTRYGVIQIENVRKKCTLMRWTLESKCLSFWLSIYIYWNLRLKSYTFCHKIRFMTFSVLNF